MTGSALENAGWVALIAIVPLLVLMLTSFVKVSVVLSLLRNAIGATDAPSGLVVMGVSLVLTFFVMAPVAVEMVQAAGTPAAGATGATQAAPPNGPRAGAPGSAARTARDSSAASATHAAPATGGSQPSGPRGAATDTAAQSTEGASEPVASGAQPSEARAGATGTAAQAAADRVATTGTAAERTGGTSVAPTAGGTPVSGGSEPSDGAGDVTGAGGTAGPPLELEAALREVVPPRLHGELDAVARGVEPLRRFLGRHAAERDRETFVALAGEMGHAARGDELWVLAPAFLTTELREAFAIAVLIFLPFLVIDLVVGLSLAALGLPSTSPQVVALPLKLLLFVAVDGWRLLVDSLVRGYV